MLPYPHSFFFAAGQSASFFFSCFKTFPNKDKDLLYFFFFAAAAAAASWQVREGQWPAVICPAAPCSSEVLASAAS